MKKERYLLKLSGEAFKNEKSFFNFKFAENIVEQIIKLVKTDNKEIVIVLGGGNICRAKDYIDNFSRIEAQTSLDYAGMLGTVINGLYLKEIFRKNNLEVGILSLLNVSVKVAQYYNLEKAQILLKKYKVLILVGGIGISNFSTDLVAAVKSKELNVDKILFGKIGIDGIYDKDPKTNSDAKFISEITFSEVINKKLQFIDLTAASFSLENQKELYVFNIQKSNAIINVLAKKGKYSIVKN